MRTTIGYGSPNKAGTSKVHGAPLGPDEVRLTKQAYGLDPDTTFAIAPQVLTHFRTAAEDGEARVDAWEKRLTAYADAFPEGRRAAAPHRARARAGMGCRPAGYAVEDGGLATRNASRNALQALKSGVPELIGGSADLSGSNLTDLAGEGVFTATESGRNIRFGVREHAMGGIANGIAYHGGLLPFVGTFLNFSDYMRGSVRLAALSGLHVIYVWTHDSVGVGEDGPTHQPVEHYAALRAIPNLTFVRPGDPNEASAAWALAVEHRHGPTALAFTRQKLPVLPGTAELARDGVRAGAYVLAEAVDCRRHGDGAPAHPHRHRLGAAPGHGRARDAHRRRRAHARGLDAQLGALRGTADGLPRRGAAPRGHGPRVHRGRRLAGLGPLGQRPRAAPSWPSTATGSRRRPARSSRSSASAPTTSSGSRAASSPARCAASSRPRPSMAARPSRLRRR